ncbi:uncharacterized protein LOC116347682 [Contarinia nasturtii]|uniref:uncharacterized protein LOC116347682 n=1 Tax=Contarinia nasturtii TaxID=265458 RepID=UPI0012D3C285|nr:uncharacterized protein LOC116347682 [Contarinia nasturtii]
METILHLSKIEDFNWNLKLFLDIIDSYKASVNKANPVTLELLGSTLDKIGDLLENVDEVESNNDAIPCEFDEKLFEIKRTIFCRICKVDFEASRRGHLLHLADTKHNGNLIKIKQGGGNASITNGTATDSNNNTGKSKSLVAKDGVQPPVHLQMSLHTYLKDLGFNREKRDAPFNNGAANVAAVIGHDALNNNETKKVIPIPNVFDDGIYDFIESIGKSDLPNKSSNKNETVNVPTKAFQKAVSSEKGPINWRNTSNEPVIRTENRVHPETHRGSNEPIVRNETYAVPPIFYTNRPSTIDNYNIPPWHVRPSDLDAANAHSQIGDVKVPSVVGAAKAKSGVELIGDADISKSFMTQSIIQNGAVLTGTGVKPCPTYELNNLYLKFPHLNPNKVANPLRPTSLDLTKRSTASAKPNENTAKSVGGLQGLFDKINQEAKLKKSESTNSLHSLPNFDNNMATNHPKHRMPERSVSSLNLTGITRMNGANPQKMNRRQSLGHNGQNKSQATGQHRNAPVKGPPQNDPRSKGAIPKYSTQNSQSNGKKVGFNDAPKTSQTHQNAQKKDVKSTEHPKVAEKAAEPKTGDKLTENLINDEKLKKFFSIDLSALISSLEKENGHARRDALKASVIESVESTLGEKFKKMKCHVIGSHKYKIAKGGRAPLDIYLDLHDSFNTDRRGQVFVAGMDETLKLLQESCDWFNAKCSEQSRYGILSATNSSTNWECNFRFGTGVAVRNSDIISTLFEAQPVARQLVISVRLALQEGAIDDWAKHFTGYVVTLLVIFYLQIAKKLPSILSLQTNQVMKCGENMVNFSKPKNVAICKDRIRDLLIGFFEYYWKFDFFNQIISPFEGREISQMFRNCPVDSLSRSMQRFKGLIDSQPQRWTNNKMCIQDIFEHKRNVGEAIHMNETKAFKALCGKALLAISSAGSAVKY